MHMRFKYFELEKKKKTSKTQKIQIKFCFNTVNIRKCSEYYESMRA